MTAAVLYIVISLLCSGGLVVFSRNVGMYSRPSMSIRYFRISMVLVALASLQNIPYAVHAFGVTVLPDAVVYLYNILYFLLLIWSGFFWFLYAERCQHSAVAASRYNIAVTALPAVLMTVLVLVTPWYHSVFSVTDGHYARGPFWLLVNLVSTVFVVYSGVSALVRSFRGVYYLRRHEYRHLFCYSAAIVLALVLQFLVPVDIPYRELAFLVMCYLRQDSIMKSNIFSDRLTNINNRAVLEKCMKERFPSADERFFYVMMDLDGFKGINDTYGHDRGDLAVRCFARALRQTVEHGQLIARVGGDEFVMAGYWADEQAVRNTMRLLETHIGQICEEEKLSFSVVFSYGYASKQRADMTVPELMKAADDAMYRTKKEKKRTGESKV